MSCHPPGFCGPGVWAQLVQDLCSGSLGLRPGCRWGRSPVRRLHPTPASRLTREVSVPLHAGPFYVGLSTGQLRGSQRAGLHDLILAVTFIPFAIFCLLEPIARPTPHLRGRNCIGCVYWEGVWVTGVILMASVMRACT